jgi:hypothetical protein
VTLNLALPHVQQNYLNIIYIDRLDLHNIKVEDWLHENKTPFSVFLIINKQQPLTKQRRKEIETLEHRGVGLADHICTSV